MIERIGGAAIITFNSSSGKTRRSAMPVKNIQTAVEMVVRWIASEDSGIENVNSLADINAVGHRVVHGGEKFTQSTLINNEVIKEIEDCIELALSCLEEFPCDLECQGLSDCCLDIQLRPLDRHAAVQRRTDGEERRQKMADLPRTIVPSVFDDRLPQQCKGFGARLVWAHESNDTILNALWHLKSRPDGHSLLLLGAGWKCDGDVDFRRGC